jgi:hypothetical protein
MEADFIKRSNAFYCRQKKTEIKKKKTAFFNAFRRLLRTISVPHNSMEYRDVENDIERQTEIAAIIAGAGLLSVAKQLREIQDANPERFAPIAKLLKIDRLDAHFIARLDRVFRDLNINDDRMMALGWPKLMTLCDYISSDNRKQLLEIANKTPAKDLEEILKQQRVGTKPMDLYLTDEQYGVLEKAILAYDGVRSKRYRDRLSGKEEALVRALSSKSD